MPDMNFLLIYCTIFCFLYCGKKKCPKLHIMSSTCCCHYFVINFVINQSIEVFLRSNNFTMATKINLYIIISIFIVYFTSWRIDTIDILVVVSNKIVMHAIDFNNYILKQL